MFENGRTIQQYLLAMIFSSYDHNNDKFVMTASLVIVDVSGF